jgi:hypothetical protein
MHLNCFHGEGTLFYADGSRYDGTFEKDQKSGKGVMRRGEGLVAKVGVVLLLF